MASQMPSRICKGDKVRLKKDEGRKYGGDIDDVWTVSLVDKVAGRPRLYAKRHAEDDMKMFWANDCELAWGKASPERKKALGYV